MDYLQWAKDTFCEDKYATDVTGIEILEVSKHYAKCRLKIERRHKNVRGTIMGGAIFTLADFAFAIASNAGNAPTVTLTAQSNFLATTQRNELIAEAHCIKDGRSTCYYEVVVQDDEGKLVAKVSINGFKVG